jgi:hypothetical protein
MDWVRIRERFLQDGIPVRLAGLAADMERIATLAGTTGESSSVLQWLEEGQRFIEWTAAELEPETAAELVNLQVILSAWCSAWQSGPPGSSFRSVLAVEAHYWSERILTLAGM